MWVVRSYYNAWWYLALKFNTNQSYHSPCINEISRIILLWSWINLQKKKEQSFTCIVIDPSGITSSGEHRQDHACSHQGGKTLTQEQVTSGVSLFFCLVTLDQSNKLPSQMWLISTRIWRLLFSPVSSSPISMLNLIYGIIPWRAH